jgi:hypothetical protein
MGMDPALHRPKKASEVADHGADMEGKLIYERKHIKTNTIVLNNIHFGQI